MGHGRGTPLDIPHTTKMTRYLTLILLNLHSPSATTIHVNLTYYVCTPSGLVKRNRFGQSLGQTSRFGQGLGQTLGL
jgi:hypothetical protein